MRIARVIETCLYVEDVERAAAWYVDVLGLERVAGSPPRDVFLKAGDTMLLLFQPEETTKTADVPSHGARGVQHIALGVEDVEPWRERLADRGVMITAEASFGAGHSLYFDDLDGNVVELVGRGTWPVW